MSKLRQENALYNYMIKKPNLTEENQLEPEPVPDNNDNLAGTSSATEENSARTDTLICQNILDLGNYICGIKKQN